MGEAHSIGGLYVSIAGQGQGAPLVDKSFTVEQEGLKRRGRGILIRIPFTKHRPTKGINIGLWDKQPSPSSARREG